MTMCSGKLARSCENKSRPNNRSEKWQEAVYGTADVVMFPVADALLELKEMSSEKVQVVLNNMNTKVFMKVVDHST